MTAFCELEVLNQAMFAVFAIILTVAAAFLLVESFALHIGKKYAAAGIIIFTAVVLLFQCFDDLNIKKQLEHKTDFAIFVGNLPWAACAAIMVLIAAAEAFLTISLMKRRKNMLNSQSIKQSVDALPDGVCFYATDGQPLLVNTQMNRICGDLFDKEILNANRFIERLKTDISANIATIIRTEPTVIVEMNSGKVWDFHNNAITVGKSQYYELIAFDITEQYKLSRELKQRNERLNRVNERLRRFSEEMVTFTAEKELLEAKIKVHDSIGRCLLSWRAYLSQNEDERNRKELLFLWQYVVSVMKNEALPSGEWNLIENSANMLGIAISLDGDLPENLRQRAAIDTAIRECLTNTARHAHGDRLFVNIDTDGDRIIAEITNTGTQPSEQIQEKGGLKNLRRVVEYANGKMTVESKPRFLLRLEFEKGDTSEWLRQEYWS